MPTRKLEYDGVRALVAKQLWHSLNVCDTVALVLDVEVGSCARYGDDRKSADERGAAAAMNNDGRW